MSAIKKEVTNTCTQCGKGYWVKPYRVSISKFCSFKCSGKYRARVSLNTKESLALRSKKMIGNTYRLGLKPKNSFVTEQVSGEGSLNWVESIKSKCEHCNNEFSTKPWVINQNGLPRFCSRDCFEQSGVFKGNKSKQYVGGKQTYRGRNWHEIRKTVVSDQNGICFSCDKYVGKSLPVHHIKPFREFKCSKDANKRNNLVGLCQSCHMKVENGYNCKRIQDAYDRPDMFIQAEKQPEPKQEVMEI